MGEPTASAGAAAGQRWLYFRSPWGMQFELVSYPDGKAYERDAPVKLWHPAGRPSERGRGRMEQMTLELPAHGAAGARIAAELREAILTGEYAPGARIRQEDLAGRHGASRVPVREALRMLEAEGLVTLVANTGAWVSTPEPGRVRRDVPDPRADRAAAAALQHAR